ncbi:BTB/POZ domain-containing protein 19 isoform X2 [Loxodonta africana]|uniref:BTB/POZ domain-containing protein 19 isoform X2 n=1 Tax=Loxodonta africana TaxID=9785 RepID=UPI000C8146E0|nr:BTB/POZ domain-containing protein 19 isoform X2 [Loxodonta africana]
METPGLVVHGEAEPFSTALRSLINNPQYSDVRFVVGQEQREVFAHRCLLACRCNFFQRLLGMEPGSGVPSPVVLSTVPAEAFLAVLEFLYTNSVKLHYHSVSPMSRGLGGKSWGYKRWEEFMHHVCAEGQGKLPFALQPPNLQVLEVLTAAVEYGLEELREVGVTFGLGPLQERCMTFIEAHSQEVLRTRGFLELSAAALLPLLRSDKLCVDEAELIRAARSWARVGAAVLERPVAEVAAPVVRELRLALLAPAELSALEEQNRREPLIPVRSEEPGIDPLRSVEEGRGGHGTAHGLRAEGALPGSAVTGFPCRWSRSWRHGNVMPCREGTRPGAPCAAAGRAPCPASITAFWTCRSSDPAPQFERNPGPT